MSKYSTEKAVTKMLRYSKSNKTNSVLSQKLTYEMPFEFLSKEVYVGLSFKSFANSFHMLVDLYLKVLCPA